MSRDPKTTYALALRSELQKRAATFGALMKASKPDVDQYIQQTLVGVMMNPKLQSVHPESVARFALQAAQVALTPFTPQGLVYGIPFSNQLTLIIGVNGYREIARRNNIRTITRSVWKGEAFDIDQTALGEVPVHKIDLDLVIDPSTEKEMLRGCYTQAVFPDGYSTVKWMNIGQLENHRKKYALVKGDKGPWSTNFVAMAEKTTFRLLARKIPMSYEISNALRVDGADMNRWKDDDIIEGMVCADMVEDAQIFDQPQERHDRTVEEPPKVITASPTPRPRPLGDYGCKVGDFVSLTTANGVLTGTVTEILHLERSISIKTLSGGMLVIPKTEITNVEVSEQDGGLA